MVTCALLDRRTQAYVNQMLSTEGMQISHLHFLKMRPSTTTIIIILCWCYNPVLVWSPPWFPNSKCFLGHNVHAHAQPGGPGTALYLAPYPFTCLAWVDLPKAYSRQHSSPGHRPLHHKAVIKELRDLFFW